MNRDMDEVEKELWGGLEGCSEKTIKIYGKMTWSACPSELQRTSGHPTDRYFDINPDSIGLKWDSWIEDDPALVFRVKRSVRYNPVKNKVIAKISYRVLKDGMREGRQG